MTLSPYVFDASRANFNELVLSNSRKGLVLDGQPSQALALLTALPAEARRDGRIAPLLAHLELIAAAEQDPGLLTAGSAEHELTRRYRAKLAGH